jgi:hypothetical protein
MALPLHLGCGIETAALPVGEARLWVIRYQATLVLARMIVGYAGAMPIGLEQRTGRGRRFSPILDADFIGKLLFLVGLLMLSGASTRPGRRLQETREDADA